MNTSIIKASYIGIYSTNTWLSQGSLINSVGKGCNQSYGYGCGFLDWIMGLRLQCGGTGASHGGMGGQSLSPSVGYIQTCLQMTSRNIYDNPFDPIFEGSGGGGQNQSSHIGRGGGVIYMESALQVINDGLIDCSGNLVNMKYSGSYYGSGSGGSIQIHTINLAGNGKINCSGGGVQRPSMIGYGGNGGGGRIKLNLTQWFRITQQEVINNQFSNSSLNLNVTAQAGQSYESSYNFSDSLIVSIQQQGSVITTPCLQGYEVDVDQEGTSSFLCRICPNGYYKFQINTGQCLKCSNNNNNNWTFNQINSTSPICEVIGCTNSKQSFYNRNHNSCQYEYEYIMSFLGGQNGVFAIIISLILFLISIFIFIIKKARKGNSSANNYQSIIESIDPGNIMARRYYQQICKINREESSAKTNFVVEDLPYHVMRLYLTGNNSYNKPLQSYDNFVLEFTEIQEKGPLQLLFQDFNKEARFSCIQKWSLIILRYYYYPLYYIMLEYLRKSKFVHLTKFLEKKKFDSLSPNVTGVYFKFSASTDFTLAYIDILNYHQDVLGWTNETQFPVTFVLQGSGTFLYPLQINLSDPLLKSLHLTFQNHLIPNSSDIDQDDKNQISCFSLERYVSEFNKRAKLIDFRQQLHQFQKYFINLSKFTDEWNEDFFSKVGVQIDLCVHIMENNPTKEYDKSKFILVRNSERKKLEQWLEGIILNKQQIDYQDIHTFQNFSDDFTIRFSVNFDLIRKGSQRIKEQIGLIASNNLNRQIARYKQSEDDREQLNNLKLAMKRRIDQGEEEKKGLKTMDNQELCYPSNEYFYQNYSNYVNFDEAQQVIIYKKYFQGKPK